MQFASLIPQSIALIPHSTARDKCIAKAEFKAGSCILSTPEFASVLLDSEKGRRCDTCFRLPSPHTPLKRCSGCGAYWYCDAQCQALQWQAHHKKICKTYNAYLASTSYDNLPLHQKMDAIMLSHTLAELSLLPNPYAIEESSQASVLMSLLPYPADPVPPLGFCSIIPTPPAPLAGKLYGRFGNNNFAIHSHLTTIGHGIFPIASRLFNHSCLPNAAAKYVLSRGKPVEMQVVALRDILPREEICLTYLDPALLETREQILDISYGFRCECPSSLFLGRIGRLPEVPSSSAEISLLERQLREFVGLDLTVESNLPHKSINAVPPTLYCLIRESYLQDLSERFSKASHEGQYDLAMESGMTLLSLYILVYPVNYPQIGMHILELAKTAWNSTITSVDFNISDKETVRVLLTMTRQAMNVFGREGDDDGPFEELETLEKLLKGEEGIVTR